MDASVRISSGVPERTWSGELRATLALAWPLVLSNLTTAIMGATDVVLMGWLGPRQLAASALGLNLYFGLGLFALGVVVSGSPMMASALGRRTHSVREVRRTFRQSLWLALAATLPLWLLLWNAEPIILALGQEPGLAAQAAIFLKGYMWIVLPWLAFQAMRNFLSALERPGWILGISVLGIALNGIISWALIFGRLGLPALGIFGGGLGSSIVWLILALLLALVISTDRQFRRFHLFGNLWRPDWRRFRHLFQLGLPIGLAMGFETIVFGAAAYLMGLIGAASLAAHAVALQVCIVTFMVPLGLSQAVTVRVGRALGAGDRGGITRAGWTAWFLGVGFMAVMALIIWTVPHQLVSIFIASNPTNAEVTNLAVSFLMFAAAFQIFDGAQVVGAGMLRGLHDTRVPMIFALLGYWLFGLGGGIWLAFGLKWEGKGVWTGLAAGLGVVAVLMLWRWSRRDRLGLLSATA
jgi:MATE family multidrug resistance protein